MISSQKLIMIVFLLNFMIGVAGEIYVNPTSYANTRIENEIDALQEKEQAYRSEGSLWVKGSDAQEYENSVGNSMTWGKTIWDILLGGFNPWSINANQFTTTIEKGFANIIITFRSLLTIVFALEVYMIMKNKKTS